MDKAYALSIVFQCFRDSPAVEEDVEECAQMLVAHGQVRGRQVGQHLFDEAAVDDLKRRHIAPLQDGGHLLQRVAVSVACRYDS